MILNNDETMSAVDVSSSYVEAMKSKLSHMVHLESRWLKEGKAFGLAF